MNSDLIFKIKFKQNISILVLKSSNPYQRFDGIKIIILLKNPHEATQFFL